MGEPPFDLAACVARVRQRDEEAASRMVEHLYPLVIKIVRAHRSPRLAEEDVAQEIFLRVFAKLDQYRGEVAFEHWVSRVAVNVSLNALRSLKCRPELRWADLNEAEAEALGATLAGGEPSAEQSVAARDLVEKLLDCLNPEDRLVISLMDLEERSVAEVRRITGWSEAMVKVRAFRARRKLRKHLERFQRRENL